MRGTTPEYNGMHVNMGNMLVVQEDLPASLYQTYGAAVVFDVWAFLFWQHAAEGVGSGCGGRGTVGILASPAL